MAVKTRFFSPPRLLRNAAEAGNFGKDGRPSQGLAARDVVVLLILGSRVVQTVLRMAMGALVIYICEEYQCGASSKGWLLSAHAFGYCTTQILGGHMADRFGGRLLIGMSMLGAGISLVLTPMAAKGMGLAGVIVLQVVMGIAMGPLFPASVQLLAKWLPPQERGFGSTALDSGITLGCLIVVPCSGFLATLFGWQSALAIFGSVAVAYSVLWMQIAPESPDTCKFCTQQERRFLAHCIVQSKSVAKNDNQSFVDVLSYVCLWAIYISHFTFNYGVYFINCWSATYYLDTFGIRPEDAAFHLSLPHATNMLVMLFVNPLLEHLFRKKHFTTLECRRAFSCLGFGISGFCFAVAPLISGIHATTACFSLALGAMALHPRGFKANYMDVTRTRGGVVSGIGNTIASAASSFGPLIVAYLQVSAGSWAPSFHSVCILNVIAAIFFSTSSSTTPIEDQVANVQLFEMHDA